MTTAKGRSGSPGTPEEAIERFGERLNAGDLEGVLALYEDVAAFAPEPGAEVTGSRPSARL